MTDLNSRLERFAGDLNPAGSDKRLVVDLNRLVDRPKDPATLAPPAGASPINAAMGRAKPTEMPSATSGIASPLTETAYSARTFHPTVSVNSTDAVFALEIKRVKLLKMIDANKKPVDFIYAKP